MIQLQRQNGISLIEILISIVILSVGLLALSGFTGNLYRNVDHAKKRSEGLALAQKIIDNYRTKGSATMIDGGDVSPADCSTAELRRYWKVADVAGGNGVKHLTVNVCWTNAQGQVETITTSSFIGLGNTAVTLGSPPTPPPIVACVGTAYVDGGTYSEGTSVYLNSKQYKCLAKYASWCGQVGFRPSNPTYGPDTWGAGVTCIPP